jgi:hypothetical protein
MYVVQNQLELEKFVQANSILLFDKALDLHTQIQSILRQNLVTEHNNEFLIYLVSRQPQFYLHAFVVNLEEVYF